MKLQHQFNKEDILDKTISFSAIVWHNYRQIDQIEFRRRRTNKSFGLKYFKLREKLFTFYNIKDNWDGEGSAGISENTVTLALTVFEKLKAAEIIENRVSIHVFPTFESTIQFELDSKLFKADIEITTEKNILLFIYNVFGDLQNHNIFNIDSIPLLVTNIKEKVLDYA